MTQPIEVDLPHHLGKDEARRRIADNVGKLGQHIPGGARIDSSWDGDRLNLLVHAMGDSVNSTIDVEDTRVRFKLVLPGMLGMFAGPIQSVLKAKGGLLLEDHRKG